MSSASEQPPNMTGENTTRAADTGSAIPNSSDAVDVGAAADQVSVMNEQIATQFDRLDQVERGISQLDAITSEISTEASASKDESAAGAPPIALLEPRLASIQNSIFNHQVELRAELHAMRAEFGKLQQQQDDQVSKLDVMRDRLQERMNTLGLSRSSQLAVTIITGIVAVAVVGWVGSSIVSAIRRATSSIQPDSPEAFVYGHLEDIRDKKLDDTWAQAAESFKEQAAQGDFEAYKQWWTEVAYPLPETAVTNVTQVKLYTEWSYCNRETNEILQNVGFWYLSKVPGNEWRLDRIEIPPNLPARKVGQC